VVRPDQVWVADITYIRLLQEFVYLAIIMDVFTRGIRGWYLGRRLDQELTLTALKPALLNRTPEIHHSDQGVQYAATAYVDLLAAHDVAISMAEVGQAWHAKRGYVERVTLAPCIRPLHPPSAFARIARGLHGDCTPALQVQVSALSRPVLTGLCPCRRAEERVKSNENVTD